MARAKRTERAEARRRFRATQAETAAETETDGSAAPTGGPAGRAGSGGRAAMAPSEQRPSFLATLTSTMRRPDVREDARALPGIVRSRPWILVPFGLVIVGGLAALTGSGPGGIQESLMSIFLVQPVVLYVAVGFLAPRGSYIFGALLALLAAVIYIGIVVLGIGVAAGSKAATDVGAGAVFYTAEQVVQGAVFAGLMSWYRDLLKKMNQQNQARADARKKAERRTTRRPPESKESARPASR